MMPRCFFRGVELRLRSATFAKRARIYGIALVHTSVVAGAFTTVDSEFLGAPWKNPSDQAFCPESVLTLFNILVSPAEPDVAAEAE